MERRKSFQGNMQTEDFMANGCTETERPASSNVFAATMILAIALFAMILSSAESSAILSSSYAGNSPISIDLSRAYYPSNDFVNISLVNLASLAPGEELSLEVSLKDDPAYSFKYLGVIDGNILFVPKKPGNYVISLYSSRGSTTSLISQRSLLVYDSDISSCSEHAVGESIDIRLDSYAPYKDSMPSSLYILYSSENRASEKYVYSEQITKSISYRPSKAGKYSLYADDEYLDCFSAVSPSGDADISSLVHFQNPESLREMFGASAPGPHEFSYLTRDEAFIASRIGFNDLLDAASSSTLDGEIAAMSSSAGAAKHFAVRDHEGRYRNAYIIANDAGSQRSYEGDLLGINNQSISSDLLDVDIHFSQGLLRKISFKSVDMKGGLDVRSEDVPISELGQAHGHRDDFINAFAIDPSSVSFSEAELSFVAQGRELWKCKEYDFSARVCNGDFIKIMDLVPGYEYVLRIGSNDPVFAQTGYLTNPSFTNDITGWTQLVDTGVISFNWLASDGAQSGVAEIANTANNRNYIGSLYQQFNLSLPNGTSLANVSFSALWRVNAYAQPGNVYFWIQDSTRATTYCAFTQAFSNTTAWSTAQLQTVSPACNLTSFAANNNYVVRLRCNLVTSTAIRNERCLWDDVNVTAFYLDVQSPVILALNDSPDPVNYSQAINFTVNATDNVQVQSVRVSINGTNYTMGYSAASGLYFFDQFNTTIFPQPYPYTVYVNDTSGNMASSSGSFTINDTKRPRLSIISPAPGAYSNASNVYFYYNASDESHISNCSLSIDNVMRTYSLAVAENVQQSLNASLGEGQHYWNISCYDNSSNRNSNTSTTALITVDTTSPAVALNYPPDSVWISAYPDGVVSFNYTPVDNNFMNCSLYANFSGIFSFNQTNTTVSNNTQNSFRLYVSDGVYLWNVQCCDMVGNCRFAGSNYAARIDSTPPYWDSNISYPLSGQKYSPSQSYQFNISWNDSTTTVASVVIENNFSGTMQNSTPLKTGTVYSYAISGLAAGSYAYKWYAIDSAGNINSTPQYSYVVLRTESNLSLLLNGLDSNVTIGRGDYVNTTARISIPSQGYMLLYMDGTLINSGYGNLTNISQFNTEKIYNMTVKYAQTQNYSASESTHFVNVIDTTPPWIELGNPKDYAWYPETITFYYTPHDNIGITNCTLIVDDINISTQNAVKDVLNNFTATVSEGMHNWTVGCIDLQGNYGFNSTLNYFRVDTISPGAFSLSSPQNNTISNNSTPLLSWAQTTEANFANYTIHAASDPAFSSIIYTYSTSGITNTSYRVPAAWAEGIWYWRVVAYDMAGNNYSAAYHTYTVDITTPGISIISPQDKSYSSSLTQAFQYSVSDAHDIANCSIYINGILNQTNSSINQSVTQRFTISFSSEGNYNWTVRCFDIAGNYRLSASTSLYIDTTNPTAVNLIAPANNSWSRTSSSSFSWSQSTEQNFHNYTLFISDNASFPYYNYTYNTFNISNISYVAALPDAVWYWKVGTYDKAGNGNASAYFAYTIDTVPPAQFNLSTPYNDTSSRNNTPLLNWTQTTEQYFLNYTVQVSTNPFFSYLNYTYSAANVTNTNYSATNWPMNNTWYWRVVAYDKAGNNYTTSSFTYITDNENPIVTAKTPLNNTNWTTNSLVTFTFNVSDLSDIANCSLIVNGIVNSVTSQVLRNVDQTIYATLGNGQSNWSINCTDNAGNSAASAAYALFVDVKVPNNIFYETSPSATALLSDPASVNLSYSYDAVENYAQHAATGGVDYNMLNASMTFNASGFLLSGGSPINFSGVFMASTRNDGYVNWGIYIKNASGTYLICQTPAGTSGQLITVRNTRQALTGNCTAPVSDILFRNGDSMVLRVNIYSGGSTTYTHYIDNADASYVQLNGYKLGTLGITLFNLSDPRPGEGESFTERCNVSCSDGYCMDTKVTLQLNNSQTQTYAAISDSGRITLNSSQQNPLVSGNINSTSTLVASLFGNVYSAGNYFRCIANSTYSSALSSAKTITVVDKTFPVVSLVSPAQNAVVDKGILTLSYIPSDAHLKNCSLYTNVTGAWVINQTQNSPANILVNNFSIYLYYGSYRWNVQCCDLDGNCAFDAADRIVNVTGNILVNAQSVYFSDRNPIEGENVTIFANITNAANISRSNVLVRFYEGDPDASGVQLGPDIYVNMTPNQPAVANTSWIASQGTHYFYVKVDPLNSILENNESDNKAYSYTFTSAWQLYYGDVSAVTVIGQANSTIINWSVNRDIASNLYIADYDSAINWTALKAIGRDSAGLVSAQTSDDFAEIDQSFGISAEPDNVNSTYTQGNAPILLSSYNIYGRQLDNVPSANSTNSTNFYTGILWDSSDGASSYYIYNADPASRQDLVFVTESNSKRQGRYGIYDYELRVPAALKNYKGSSSSLAFYYELK